MKRAVLIFSVIIMMMFQAADIFAAYTPYMFTNAHMMDGEGNKITHFGSFDTVTFSGTVKKNTVSVQDAYVLGVLYQNGVVMGAKFLDVKNPKSTDEVTVEFNIKLPQSKENLMYKVFIWDMENNKPLAQPFEFPGKDKPALEPDAIIVTTVDELISAVAEKNNMNGGTIYIKADRLDCDKQVKLSASPLEPVKIFAYPGYTPVLDFSALDAVNDSGVGIRITGNNYHIKGLIIEKAPDNGIQIKCPTTAQNLLIRAGNSVVEDCILRYNKDSGIQITKSAENNIIRNCYSYRNFDVYTSGMGGNADGFAIKLSYDRNNAVPSDNVGYGNKLIHCYAWENSDDGYDSFDWHEDLSYENCMAWNNGDVNIFTGKCDFDSGKPLDENSPLIGLFMKDEAFRTNIENGIFELPKTMIIPGRGGTVASAIQSWGGNPNGYKFGSASVTSKNTIRTGKNMIALDHLSKGFDRNNSSSAAIGLSNALSFNNGRNYELGAMTITKFENVFGFNGKNSDSLPGSFKVTAPDADIQKAYEDEVRSMINYIENSVRADIIPMDIDFSFWD